MALNFSHRPIFTGHLSEDNLVSPIRIVNGYVVEGVQERNGDASVRPWHMSREVGSSDYGRDWGDRGGSQESVPNDILDLLPSDPFGMDISTTVTAITGWLEDLEVDYGGFGMDDAGAGNGDYELFAGLNFIWNTAMRFQAYPGNSRNNDISGIIGCSTEKQVGDVPCCTVGCQTEECSLVSGSCSPGDNGAPHAALSFALGYLGVRDLIAAESVCRSLRSTVQSDPLLWRSIHIDQPLNEKLTDDVLLELSSRAQGNMQCLTLVECPRITEDCLKQVLDSNPRLIKLSVPGCTRISIEAIVSSLKAFKSTGTHGIKHLRIGGLYGMTREHLEELMLLLGTDSQMQHNTNEPHFFHMRNFYLSCDDDRSIDVEMCPRCQNVRLVYDCPAEGCQGKEHGDEVCRACTLCISRCVQCGWCINDSEYEETFCLELLCLKCQERQDREAGPSNCAILHEPNCPFCLHG